MVAPKDIACRLGCKHMQCCVQRHHSTAGPLQGCLVTRGWQPPAGCPRLTAGSCSRLGKAPGKATSRQKQNISSKHVPVFPVTQPHQQSHHVQLGWCCLAVTRGDRTCNPHACRSTLSLSHSLCPVAHAGIRAALQGGGHKHTTCPQPCTCASHVNARAL